MFFQFLDGAPLEAMIPIGAVCVMLPLARVVKNLPKDAITKFFEHRTSKYQIVAGDAKGRVAAMQKQRLMFLGFVVACAAVVGIMLISSTTNEAQVPSSRPIPRSTASSTPNP